MLTTNVNDSVVRRICIMTEEECNDSDSHVELGEYWTKAKIAVSFVCERQRWGWAPMTISKNRKRQQRPMAFRSQACSHESLWAFDIRLSILLPPLPLE